MCQMSRGSPEPIGPLKALIWEIYENLSLAFDVFAIEMLTVLDLAAINGASWLQILMNDIIYVQVA